MSVLTSDRPLSNDDRLDLWRIQYDPKPIPSRAHDYDFHHVDFDGAPDSGDNRCGTAESISDAINQITEFSSPPERHPERVSAWSVIRDAFGFCLWMAALYGWVLLVNWALELL